MARGPWKKQLPDHVMVRVMVGEGQIIHRVTVTFCGTMVTRLWLTLILDRYGMVH